MGLLLLTPKNTFIVAGPVDVTLFPNGYSVTHNSGSTAVTCRPGGNNITHVNGTVSLTLVQEGNKATHKVESTALTSVFGGYKSTHGAESAGVICLANGQKVTYSSSMPVLMLMPGGNFGAVTHQAADNSITTIAGGKKVSHEAASGVVICIATGSRLTHVDSVSTVTLSAFGDKITEAENPRYLFTAKRIKTFKASKMNITASVLEKYPSEKFSINVDFTDLVGPAGISLITVTALLGNSDSTAVVIDTQTPTPVGSVVPIIVKAGQPNEVHNIKVKITCSDGSIYVHMVNMRIMEIA